MASVAVPKLKPELPPPPPEGFAVDPRPNPENEDCGGLGAAVDEGGGAADNDDGGGGYVVDKVVVFYQLTGEITGKTVLPVCW